MQFYDHRILETVAAADRPLRHSEIAAKVAPGDNRAWNHIGTSLTRLYRAGQLARERADGHYWHYSIGGRLWRAVTEGARGSRFVWALPSMQDFPVVVWTDGERFYPPFLGEDTAPYENDVFDFWAPLSAFMGWSSMIRFLDATGLAQPIYAVEIHGETYTSVEIAARLTRTAELERAIEAEWAAWYMYDADPMHQDAEAAHAVSCALWALIGKEPAP